jgi:hypothetical protein
VRARRILEDPLKAGRRQKGLPTSGPTKRIERTISTLRDVTWVITTTGD